MVPGYGLDLNTVVQNLESLRFCPVMASLRIGSKALAGREPDGGILGIAERL